MPTNFTINRDRLLDTFLTLVQIDSPSGEEEAIARHLADRLIALGLAVHHDNAGNLIARTDSSGEPLLLNAHMDTVGQDRGIRPIVENGIVRTDGTTILGGDDKSGVAIILEVLQTMRERGLPYPPLEIALTVSEEIGLLGSKALDMSQFQARQALVLDSGGPIENVVVSAPSQDVLHAVIHGKAAHAGVIPEEGINAIVVAAEAITHMPLGRIDEETTANIGLISGGTAINIVPDRAELHGEARSRNENKLVAQVQAMTRALEEAAARHGAGVEIKVTHSFSAYTLDEDSPLVQRVIRAAERLGLTPSLVTSGGGSDANVFNAGGLAALVLSTGMKDVHTPQETIAVEDMVRSAELVLNIVQ
ncbi:MAG: M20/M25/M40 family metallo-hydrolase [Anaerolineae bacterium]|jgi:tripeptide aminopeptidase|nr:M20/M25/M40 family metallo-hydrolase [Anaerolineae bacterium]MDH7474876.1 M20/M25/M40 family metallo-hydrolase [Anaerolineae bacterium]